MTSLLNCWDRRGREGYGCANRNGRAIGVAETEPEIDKIRFLYAPALCRASVLNRGTIEDRRITDIEYVVLDREHGPTARARRRCRHLYLGYAGNNAR
jgi:hypothetical protein